MLCMECGALFQVLTEDFYQQLTETVYTTESWGKTKETRLHQHGPRLRSSLDWFHANAALKPGQRYLDIGAGIGIVEHLLIEKLDSESLNITAIEPVAANADLLQKDYPQIKVVVADVESIESPARDEQFDVVICFGVDYLFRDLDAAFRLLKSMVRDNGRVLINRNVFLDMPCFWGGAPIRTFSDLVSSNPLITLFLFEDQYRELLGRHFKINAAVMAEEKYNLRASDNHVNGRFLLADCEVDHTYARDPQPIKQADKALARLRELGIALIEEP